MQNYFLKELKSKFDLLLQSGIFTGWSEKDVLGLAIISRLKNYDRNTVIIQQGEKPSNLYILNRGTCNVYKFSEETMELQRDLKKAKYELEKAQAKYYYHHSIRKTGLHPEEYLKKAKKAQKAAGRPGTAPAGAGGGLLLPAVASPSAGAAAAAAHASRGHGRLTLALAGGALMGGGSASGKRSPFMTPANLSRAGSRRGVKKAGGGKSYGLSVAPEPVSLLQSPGVAQSLGALKRDGLLVTVGRKESLLRKARRAETRDAVRKQTEICKLYPPAMAGTYMRILKIECCLCRWPCVEG